MSYILDALKKSEKERQHGMVPDFSTVQDASVLGSSRRSLWPYLLLAALLLNAGILVWWLSPWQSKNQKVIVQPHVQNQPDLKSSIPSSPEPAKTGSPAVNPAETAPTRSKIVVTKQTVNEVNAVQQDLSIQKVIQPQKESNMTPQEVSDQPPIISHAPSEPADINIAPVPEDKIYTLNELPSSILRDLPAFSVSTHIYSVDPASRMVRINGKTMREGQELIAGLKLEEITSGGVILSYNNYRFNVGLK